MRFQFGSISSHEEEAMNAWDIRRASNHRLAGRSLRLCFVALFSCFGMMLFFPFLWIMTYVKPEEVFEFMVSKKQERDVMLAEVDMILGELQGRREAMKKEGRGHG